MIELPDHILRKIISTDSLGNILTNDLRNGNQIVFTNGCFDILHLGHLYVLSKAKAMGSILIVGLNSDSSVRAIKGADRPIQNENTRSAILASIEYVDYLVLFSEDTPLSIIKLIKPDILVKGGDYSEKDIVGYDFLTSYGGKIITVPLLDGYSTTKLIDKSGRDS